VDKYKGKKQRAQGTEEFAEEKMTPNTYRRLCECGSWIDMYTDKDLTKFKVHQANFCKNRFCPMCAWRQAKKDALKVSVMMDYAEDVYDMRYIFVTLTAPNVTGDKLIDAIKQYNKAFKALLLRKEIIPISQGFIRKLEVTYDGEETITRDMWEGTGRHKNKARANYYMRRGFDIGDANPNYDTYHPHFHCIFAVKKSYFDSRYYVKQEKWLNLWRAVMKDESITQVRVQRVRKIPGKGGKAVNEIAKYAAKDTDMTQSQEVYNTFYDALKGRQVLTFGGVFIGANKKFKDKELDDYIALDDTPYFYEVMYSWGGEEYVELERRELTEDEQLKLAGQLIIELDIDQ